jgi:hypothetical protein
VATMAYGATARPQGSSTAQAHICSERTLFFPCVYAIELHVCEFLAKLFYGMDIA